jgi:hypothetical protein
VSRSPFVGIGGRRFYFEDNDIGDDEDERRIADPDEITDWTGAEPDQQKETQDMSTYASPEQYAEALQESEGELTKAKAELAAAQARLAELEAKPELTPEEALAQVRALGDKDGLMYTKDAYGQTVLNPQGVKKAVKAARKADVKVTPDRRGRW